MSKKLDKDLLHRTRYENLGRWLSLAFRYYEEGVIRRMNELGFEDIRLVHASLIRCVDSDGSRFTEIAERAGMHKQAIGQLVRECEETGYVERKPDPEDGRAQLVCFTKRGKKLLRALSEIHSGTESDFTEIIGADRIADFKADLVKVACVKRNAEELEESLSNIPPPVGVRRKRGRPPKGSNK